MPALAAIRREAQRLFVPPDGRALARLHRMCDIRLAAVNPAARKWSRGAMRSNFLIFFFIVFRPIMINKTFDFMGGVTAAEPAR
jgi:hypothetical protein